MRRSVPAAVLLLLSAVILPSQEHDVRESRWGMSPEEVAASEPTIPIYRDSDHLYYGISTVGLEAICMYRFQDGGLIQVSYIFTEDHAVAELNRYLDDFRSMERVLRGRFGEPLEEHVIWKDPRLKDQPEEHGFAVSIDHLAFDALYRDTRTWAVHLLEGTEHSVTHSVLFQPRTDDEPSSAF